nr:chlorophyll c synthase [Breviolum minutum]
MTSRGVLTSAAVTAATTFAACNSIQAFTSPSTEKTNVSTNLRHRSQQSDGKMGAGGLGLTAGLCVAAAAVTAPRRVLRKAVATGKEEKQAMSTALPWMPVPAHLRNEPTHPDMVGDLGFDPLGFGADEYINEVLENFGLEFNAMRWYREAELMHGRVCMLAVFKVIVDSSFPGVMPKEEAISSSTWELVQMMALLEAFRGYRLFVNQDAIAGDLGLGAGPMTNGWKMTWDMTLEELAEKQYRELQNGRLAMLAFAGMATQYLVTGNAVGFADNQQPFSFIQGVDEVVNTNDMILTFAGMAMAIDGVRRLSFPDRSIAGRALNVTKLQVGVQDPEVALPAGVTSGQAPQELKLTEEQIKQFEEDGVIMIKGGMKAWVKYLQKVTEDQIEKPHLWSLVGRMSGMYDYIQRNMWMTNDGFRDFLYYSPLGHVVSQLGRTEEVRCSTDMLLVNPNRGFGWHQDNQNGPIDFKDAIRWWVAMDACGQDGFGAPEYLLGSHRNESVSSDAVFVNLEDGDLTTFPRKTRYTPEPGDLIVWDSRTIHRIVAPPGQKWEAGTQRRAIGGTMAKAGATYINKGGASGISDLAGHNQQNGELLGGPYFPRIYPSRVKEEEECRANNGIVGRSPQKIVNLGVTLASNASKYVSFTKVVGKKD